MTYRKLAAAALLVGTLGAAAPASAGPRMVKVVDETNRGVESAILLNASGNEWQHLGYTGPDGSATVDIDCRSGLRLMARPGNSGRYWDSPPQDCTQERPLRVVSKLYRRVASDDVSVQELKLADGRNWFLVLRPVLAVEKQESRTAGSVDGAACLISVSATFQRVVYEETPKGDWRVVNLAAEAPRAVRPWGSEQLASMVAPSRCANAAGEVAAAEAAAMTRLGAATDLAASWQTYGIAKSNPVDSVQLLFIAGQ